MHTDKLQAVQESLDSDGRPFRVDFTDPRNTKMIAKENLKSGARLYEESPYELVLLSEYIDKACSTCLKTDAPKYYKCAGCG